MSAWSSNIRTDNGLDNHSSDNNLHNHSKTEQQRGQKARPTKTETANLATQVERVEEIISDRGNLDEP
jgi:hypothetical protein